MRVIIFFGCFLVVSGSAWAQFGEDRWQPVRKLQSNPPSVKGFDAWYQHRREQQRQQQTRFQQKARRLQSNPLGYDYRQRPFRSIPKSLKGFDAWYQHRREQQQQQQTRYRQEIRQHEMNQRNRLRRYDRLPRGPLQPY